ncbi:MAG TPA: VWA domain-containing protein [Acidobacteriaceae bacterium]
MVFRRFLSVCRPSILPGFAVAVCLSPYCLAQAAPAPEAQLPHTATLTVNARLVVLDVVVTGKDGKPVSGLTRDDFQVFEDGKQQSIRSFESPAVHHLPADSVTAGISQVFDPAQPASFGQTPVTILVLDQINTHFADSAFARRELHNYLASRPALLSQPTEILSVTDNAFGMVHGYTRDRDALLKALDAAPTKYAWKLELNGRTEYGPLERLDQSLRALEQIAQNSARVPGRKNVVWVGGGFPTVDPTLLKSKDLTEVRETIRHVTDVLLDTRVTMYAVDPSSTAAGMTEITDETQQAFADAAGDGLAGPNASFGVSEDFDGLGPATGGRVVRGLNNVTAQIASAVGLGTEFYTIGYAPSSDNELEGRFRKIKVVCLKPGLTATTRQGYFNERTQREASGAAISYDLSTAAESSIPLTGLHVTVELNRSINAPANAYVVHVSAADLTWTPRGDGASSANVEVLAVSLSSKAKMIGHTLHGMVANAKPGVNLRDSTKNADFDFHVEPVAKTAVLRFVVRDAATGRMGSVDLPLAR